MQTWVRTVVTSFVMVGLLALPMEAQAMRAARRTPAAQTGKVRSGTIPRSRAPQARRFQNRSGKVVIEGLWAWAGTVAAFAAVAAATYFGTYKYYEPRMTPANQMERLIPGQGGDHEPATNIPRGAPDFGKRPDARAPGTSRSP